jgi:hypothetical protein
MLTHGVTSPASLRVRVRAWRLGFWRGHYELYDLDHNDHTQYLPDAAVFSQSEAEGKFRRVLVDKVLFSAVMGAHTRVPEVIAIIARGKICPMGTDLDVRDAKSLITHCERANGVFIKPARGIKGKQALRLDVSPAGIVMNGEAIGFREVEEFLAGLDDFIVTNVIQQADYAARIFPRSANTLRIITMQDPEDGFRPFIPLAAHRFGVNMSAPTDNFARGGVNAKIDLSTGRLSQAMGNPKFDPGTHERHPDTGERIEGVEIPNWPLAKQTVLDLAGTFGFLTFVGWDVIVTNDGVVVIEGNNPPSRAIQMWQPFLTDERVRRFFEYHGAVKPRRGAKRTVAG